MYDSYEDEEYAASYGRVIVFCTRNDLRALMSSRAWFLDGTFKTAPSIFTQVFAVLGSVTEVVREVQHEIALPFAYALFEGKHQYEYHKVLESLIKEAKNMNIVLEPAYVMTDFELAILNASRGIFRTSEIKACFFHLFQSICRKVQEEGLQTEYADAEDETIRTAARMMAALAFVPLEDVVSAFDEFVDQIPDQFLPIAEYFEVSYEFLYSYTIFFINNSISIF